MTVSYGAHVPFLPTRVEQLDQFLDLAIRHPDVRLWHAQSMVIEPHQLLAYCAGRGVRSAFGTCVTLLPLRHPYEAAVQARSLARLSGRTVVAGFGPGSPDFQEALLGRPYRRPLAAVREYLHVVRELLEGGVAQLDGEHVSTAASLPPADAPPVDLGLGVLRPAMSRLAGEVADTAITWLCPPSYLRDVVVPEMRTSAARAGRPAPRVVAVVHVAERRPRRDPVELALGVCGHHLRAAHYVEMLGTAGVPVDPDDVEAGARALVDHGVFLYGTRDELADRLAEYGAAGVDEVVVNLSGVGVARGSAVATRELGQLLDLLVGAPRGPSPVTGGPPTGDDGRGTSAYRGGLRSQTVG